MARRITQKESRRRELLSAHFTPLEARMLKELPRNNPARRQMIADRIDRWDRFVKIANRKLQSSAWRRSQVPQKWLNNLSRTYSKLHLRVRFGPTGNQMPLPKRSPNPWALYRWYERQYGGPGGKPYVSPWQLKQTKSGRTELQKGLIFVQKAEKGYKGGELSKATIRSWIGQKNEAIRLARGKHRARLQIEVRRLEGLL